MSGVKTQEFTDTEAYIKRLRALGIKEVSLAASYDNTLVGERKDIPRTDFYVAATTTAANLDYVLAYTIHIGGEVSLFEKEISELRQKTQAKMAELRKTFEQSGFSVVNASWKGLRR